MCYYVQRGKQLIPYQKEHVSTESMAWFTYLLPPESLFVASSLGEGWGWADVTELPLSSSLLSFKNHCEI